MRQPSRWLRIAVALLTVLLSLACSLPSLSPASGSQGSGRGSGSQDLSNPAVGLDSLQSYRAVLTLSFDGSSAGTKSQWSRTYTLVVDRTDGTRLLSIADQGFAPEASLDGWAVGTARQMLINQNGAGGACSAAAASADNQPVLPEPAAFLPPVLGAQGAASSADISGVPVDHFTFDQNALSFPGSGQASGELWLAGTGGYVVQYTLSAKGGTGFFGQDLQGTMKWNYQLSDINATPEFSLPDDCPPALMDAPSIDGAQVLTDHPGLLEFTTGDSVKTVTSFYESKLPPLGYTEDPNPFITSSSAQIAFDKPGVRLTLSVQKTGSAPADVLLVLTATASGTSAANAGPTATTPPTAAASSTDTKTRLAKALSLLMGSSSKPSALGSYHLELSESLPVQDPSSGSITQSSVQISADVQGSNYHMKETKDQQVLIEGYFIDGKEYSLSNGAVQPSLGQVQMNWVSWPLDMVMPYTIATLGASAQGSTSLEGRPADAFALDSSKASAAVLKSVQSVSLTNSSVQSAAGTVWLDHSTGALLKLTLDYSLAFKDAQGTVGPSSPGHIDLAVSQVGTVVVKLPSQP